jgi:Dihaem cytochrome c
MRTIATNMFLLASAASLLLWASSCLADGDKKGYKAEKYGPIATMPASVKAECTSCHMAYPPGLMVAKDWQRVLTRLDKHYGTDASVTPKELAIIAPYFINQASTRTDRHVSSTDLPRLTSTPWFVRKHDKHLPAGVVTHPKIKTMANCAACHTQAEKGSYSEREIVVPGYEDRKW